MCAWMYAFMHVCIHNFFSLRLLTDPISLHVQKADLSREYTLIINGKIYDKYSFDLILRANALKNWSFLQMVVIKKWRKFGKLSFWEPKK